MFVSFWGHLELYMLRKPRFPSPLWKKLPMRAVTRTQIVLLYTVKGIIRPSFIGTFIGHFKRDPVMNQSTPIQSMYRISTYIRLIFMVNCTQIYHKWMLWDIIKFHKGLVAVASNEKVTGLNHLQKMCRRGTQVLPSATSLKTFAFPCGFSWTLRKEILPWNLTWNLKMEVWKMIFLFSWVLFRFHVKFQGCMYFKDCNVVTHEPM